MNNSNDNVEAIFEAALVLKSDVERAEYLAQACLDANLRREVESLLHAHYHPDSVFDEKTIVLELPPTEGPGTRIGRYKLLQQIGEGGMGVVYMAEQEEPVRRRVALKIIKLGMDTKSVVARFEAERQALALMDHPNIAKVLDGGATETGRPYFVMELVQGVPITTFCDKAKLSAKDRLKLFIQVCQAIQSAHQKGIIHRDIKPSNVLVTLHDGVPVPKVIDFGIAKATNQKLTEKTLFTNFASMIGTPAYMSPEQAEMSGLDVDTRTDIYALGVLLYELLTGSTPFPEKRLRSLGYGEMQRVIMEEEPERPSTRLRTIPNEQRTIIARNCGEELASLSNLLQGDLDWVVMRCLEKDRTRRYETANGLAADLKRHLDNEPVLARPPSATYKLHKAIRRNKLAFSSAAAVLGALVVGVGVSTWQAKVASGARNRERAANQSLRAQIAETESAKQTAESAAQSEADQRRRIAGVLGYMQLQKAEDLLARQQYSLGIAYLCSILRGNPTNEVAAARLVSAVMLPFAVPLTEPLMHENTVSLAQFSPDGSRLVTVSANVARVLDANTGQPITGQLHHDQLIKSAEFSPDGLMLVTASEDKTAQVWDARTGHPLGEPMRHAGSVLSAQFSPDGLRVVTASEDKTARLWDARLGKLLGEPMEHVGFVISAEFSPDGTRVLTASLDGVTRAWDALTGRALNHPVKLTGKDMLAAQFSPDHLRLITSSASGTYVPPGGFAFRFAAYKDTTARLWDVRTGQALAKPLRHEDYVLSSRFSADGLKVITASMDKTARVWDAHTGLPLFEPLRHESIVTDAEFSPDGLRVATVSIDDTPRIWDANTGRPLSEPLRHDGGVASAKFSSDGSRLVTASADKSARLWDARMSTPLTEPLQHGNRLSCAEFSPDGSKVVTATWDGMARVWDAHTGLPLGQPLRHKRQVTSAHFSPDGLRVLTASYDGAAKLWDVQTGGSIGKPLRHEGVVNHAQFSPDGSRVVTASFDKSARVWDAQTGEPLTDPLRHQDLVLYAEFSADGLKVVTASADKTAQVWDAHTGARLTEPLRHLDQVASARFSPDSSHVVTASVDKTARVWDVRTSLPLTGPLRHEAEVSWAQFSADGLQVVTAGNDKTARVWDARTGQAVGEPLQHAGGVNYAEFSPDGSRVVTAACDGTARVWDAHTGLPLSQPLLHQDQVVSAMFSPDGLRVVTASWDKTAKVWEAIPVPVPVPNWFLDWAEARVGRRDSSTGEPGRISVSDQRRQRELADARNGTNLFTRVAQWVQADPATRPISPYAVLTTPEYVKHRIAENTTLSVREAMLLAPNNSLAWALHALRVSREIVENTAAGDPPPIQSDNETVAWAKLQLLKSIEGDETDQILKGAEWAAQRSIRLDPNQPESWRAVGTMQWLRNRPAEALASLDRALALQPNAKEVWELKGDILEQEGRSPEALDAYNRLIALFPLTENVQGCPRLQALDKHAAVCRKMGRWAEAIADLRLGGVPIRAANTDSRLVDLSAFYNLELGGGGLAAMLTGVCTLDGTQFDARGCLFLASGKFYPNRVPEQMPSIPVGTKGKRIHFLHGTFFGNFDPMGTPIGKYVLHFADGTFLEKPLVLGQDVLDTHADPPQPGDGNPNMVWAVRNPKAEEGDEPGRLYHTTWNNPHPETEIVSLDFISLRTTAAPFLVAVTIE